MIPDARSLQLALSLYDAPSYVRVMRGQALPDTCDTILALAAGDRGALESAARIANRPVEHVLKAARFFVEQVLLFPEADKYRVLGAGSDAPHHVLQRNMRLLMAWLHPDAGGEAANRGHAARVVTAWNALKTPELRAKYDASLLAATGARSSMRRTRVLRQMQVKASAERIGLTDRPRVGLGRFGLSAMLRRVRSWSGRNDP